MVSDSNVWSCPICGKTANSAGEPFTDLRGVSLHIAGKAKTLPLSEQHSVWVRKVLPTVNLARDGDTINQIAYQIQFYVQEEVKKTNEGATAEAMTLQELAELIDGLGPALPGVWGGPTQDVSEGGSENTVVIDSRTGEELQGYFTAYVRLWLLERELHKFVVLTLRAKHGPEWLLNCDRNIVDKCIESRREDDHKLPLDRYFDLRDVGEIIKHKANKEAFEKAFESLRPAYKDPQSEFHNGLREVNKIRNNVMHPLKRIIPSGDDLAELRRFSDLVLKFTTFG